MELHDKITILRKKNKWSQEELADKLDVSRQSVFKWETGENTPDLEKIKKLSKLFNVDYNVLLDDDKIVAGDYVCPKCGTVNDEESKFCKNCGRKLSRANECPKCGAPIKATDKFCPCCGKQLTKIDSHTSSREKIYNYVFLSLVLITTILMLIGVFGATYKVYSNIYSTYPEFKTIDENFGLKYMFYSGFVYLSQMQPINGYTLYSDWLTMLHIVHVAIYAITIIITIIASILTIIGAASSLIAGKEFNSVYLKIAMACIFAHLIFTCTLPDMFLNNILYGFHIIKLGWGTNMLFASLIIGSIALTVDLKELTIAHIVKQFLFMAVVVLVCVIAVSVRFPLMMDKKYYGVEVLFGANTVGLESIYLNLSTLKYIEYHDTAIAAAFVFNLCHISTLVAFILSLFKKPIPGAVFSFVSLAGYTTALIMLCNLKGLEVQPDLSKFGTALIALISIAFVLFICLSIYDNVKSKIERSIGR
jgi:DNA-binding XRE family transcriptional regulator